MEGLKKMIKKEIIFIHMLIYLDIIKSMVWWNKNFKYAFYF